MLRLFQSVASRATTFGLIAVIVIGLLIGAVRLALPFADLYQAELEDKLSEILGVRMRVGDMGLRLAGLAPQLKLGQVALLDPESGQPLLRGDQLRIGLNLAASLRELAPQIDHLTLVGANLAIKRLTDGSVTIAGLEDIEAGDSGALAFFFETGRFDVADSDLYWIDEKTGHPPLHLSDVRIRFDNSGERHRVGLLARLFEDPLTSLHLAGDMHGQPARPQDWRGDVYLHWRAANLDQVLEGRLPADLHLEGESLEVESWVRLQGKTITRSLSRVVAEGLTVADKSLAETAVPTRLDRLAGLFRWRRISGGWQLDLKDLELGRGGARGPDSDLGVRFLAGDDESWSLRGGSRFLDLGGMSGLLAQMTNALPEGIGIVGHIRPDGELQDLRFRVEQSPRRPLQWAASGAIRELSLDAHEQLPAVQGLRVAFAANERAGALDITGAGVALGLPRLLPDLIRLDEAAGEIRWRRKADGGLRISTEEMVATNADIATRSRFCISLPAGGGSPFLDLHTEFRDVQAAAVRRYVPSRILKKKLADWLGRAFIGGEIPSGSLLFHGQVADFPFAQQQGRFKVLFDLEDGILDFHRDWPRLEGISAQVRFENQELKALVSAARFLKNDIVEASAGIPDLESADAVEIAGRAEGSFANALRVLAETPLRKRFGALADAFEAEGGARLDLDMAIPLRRKERRVPLRLAGALTWPGPAALAIPGQEDMELTDLDGALRFSEHGLEAESIRGRLWDQPVRLRVDTRGPPGGEGAKRSTRIRGDGRFPVSVLARRFPSASWPLLKGRTRLDLRLDIGGADMSESIPPIDFELTSDLVGLAVELPEPLGKPANGARRLSLAGRLARKEALHIRGRYGNLGISLGLARQNNGKLRLARGSFNMGGGAVPLPKDKGLHLSGTIEDLDLRAWLDWWARRPASRGGDSRPKAGLRAADVRVRRLRLSDTALSGLRLELDKGGKRWEAKLSANELTGTVTVPYRTRGEPIRVRLQRLDLKGLLDHEGTAGAERAAERAADPRQAHTLDLSIEQLVWGENPLGRVVLRSRATPNGLDFPDLVLDGPLMSIRGTGSWQRTDAGPRTRLAVTAQGPDLGEFLRSLEFESLAHKAPADLGLKLEWPGGPTQPSAADVKGRIEIDIGAGSLLEVEPGVGRMLGILNLGALQRRLALDFSDLFGRGFAFEKISGKLEVGSGRATIEELVIEGPSADISIVGNANLVSKELNQVATVTPSIGTGVAIASAVAGGPLVGAAVFLADKVTGGAVDKLGRHQYVLSGPWAEPNIRRGKLGLKSKPDPNQGGFMEDTGRAGASGRLEARRGKARAEPPREKGIEKSKERPSFIRDDDDENLFLEGY